jgi:hypothetical protein
VRMDDEDKTRKKWQLEPKMLKRTSDSPVLAHRNILHHRTTSVALWVMRT